MSEVEPKRAAVLRPAMGISHDDFFRVLPRVLEDAKWRREGLSIHAEWVSGATLVARISPQRQRRIASLSLPCVDVELAFCGLAAEACAAFVQRFDVAFQKGGG